MPWSVFNHLLRASPTSLAWLLVILAAACVPDVVEPDRFVRETDAAAGLVTGTDAAPPAPDRAFGDASARSDSQPPPPGGTPGARCTLTGRWLVAQRMLATAIGQQQAAHNWFYYEVRQQGADLVVHKGLHCGFEVIKKTSLAASVDSSQAWPALLERTSSTGRTGRFVEAETGCHLTLAREVVVRGATVPHYLDPAQPLPDRTQPAGPGVPGWEDWDGDGQPGLSFHVRSALANGTLYACQREWTEYDGPTEGGADKFRVSIRYGIEQVALGRSSGAPAAIETSAAPSSDGSQHFAYFHRLDQSQATGSDAEICEQIRTLAPSLVPEAGS